MALICRFLAITDKIPFICPRHRVNLEIIEVMWYFDEKAWNYTFLSIFLAMISVKGLYNLDKIWSFSLAKLKPFWNQCDCSDDEDMLHYKKGFAPGACKEVRTTKRNLCYYAALGFSVSLLFGFYVICSFFFVILVNGSSSF